MSLKNKVVLVTGASSGIGAAIAIKSSAEGAKVVIVGRNPVKLNGVSAKCEQFGIKPLVLNADVTTDCDAKRIVSETVLHFGKLDILINNAGIGSMAGILDEELMAQFDKVIATNLRAPVYLTHLAAPYLIEAKGNIINISSMASLGVISSTSHSYSASKAALDHFTRCVALELAPKGVRVNSINPGFVKTDIFDNMNTPTDTEEKLLGAVAQSTPLGRISEPNEMAELAVFLSSDKAKGITGSCFVNDNGYLLKPIDVGNL